MFGFWVHQGNANQDKKRGRDSKKVCLECLRKRSFSKEVTERGEVVKCSTDQVSFHINFHFRFFLTCHLWAQCHTTGVEQEVECVTLKKTHHNDANFSFTTPFITLGTWGPPLMYSKKGLTFSLLNLYPWSLKTSRRDLAIVLYPFSFSLTDKDHHSNFTCQKKGIEKSRWKLKIIWWEKQGIGLHHNFPKVSHYHLHFFCFSVYPSRVPPKNLWNCTSFLAHLAP